MLHARNLIEFFYFSSNSNYSRAKDFFNHELINFSNLKDYKKRYKQICEQITHLSYKRIIDSRKEKEWNLSEIIVSLFKEANVFIDNLNDIYRTEKLLILNKNIKRSLNINNS